MVPLPGGSLPGANIPGTIRAVLGPSINPLDYGRPTPRQRRPPPTLVEWLVACGIIVLIAAILAPAFLVHHHSPSAAIRSAWNLGRIAANIKVYAAANGTAFPDRLASLWQTQLTMPTAVLIAPASSDTPAAGSTPAAIAAAIAAGGHCSYTYVGAGLTTATATRTTVVAYETTVRYAGRCNVLYGDGHVSMGPPPTVTVRP